MATQVVTKEAQARYRVEPKHLHGVVIWKIASSDEASEYEVTLVDGRFSSCTCPAHKRAGVECWPRRTALAKEAEYQQRKRQDERAASAELSAEIAAEKPVLTTHERMMRASLNGNREFSLTR